MVDLNTFLDKLKELNSGKKKKPDRTHIQRFWTKYNSLSKQGRYNRAIVYLREPISWNVIANEIRYKPTPLAIELLEQLAKKGWI